MAQIQRVTGVATRVYTENGYTHVKYHVTNVVSFNDAVIVLRSGGYETNTTKTRMNQTSNEYGLGYSVWQKARKWYVTYQGETLEFSDGMKLNREVMT